MASSACRWSRAAQGRVASPERKLTRFARERPPVPGRSCVHRTTEHAFHLCNIIRLVAEARVSGAKPAFSFLPQVQQVERHGELGREWCVMTLE